MAVAVDLGSAFGLAVAMSLGAMLLGRKAPECGPARPQPFESVARLACHGRANATAIWLGIAIAGLAVVGTIAVAADLDSRLLRVNREQSPASFYSGGLIMAAAALAAVLAWDRPERRLEWALVAIGLFALGVDETAELHERVEVRTDLPAPVVISPLAAMIGYGLWRNLPWLGTRWPALQLIAGGIAIWCISQALDPFHNQYKSVVEETLEMTGSALVVVALMICVRRPVPDEPPPE